MPFIRFIKKIFLKNKINKLSIPIFEIGEIVREEIVFHGKVQGVGFRYQVFHLAQKIGLKGFVKNLENDKVVVEVQGTLEMIDVMIKLLKEERRFIIKNVIRELIEVDKNIQDFKVIY